LHFDAEQPYIAAGSLHLPAASADSLDPSTGAGDGRSLASVRAWIDRAAPAAPSDIAPRAAAAHAAAHLVYSPPVFDGRGVRPIVRALMGVLEDARVEALACRELPGLRRLWAPLHRATAEDGDGFEALLGRLARALADAAYADPHPWIAKGRRLFFLDVAQAVPILHQPEALRAAAARLGHDIGQMRLQFNSRLYRPVPAYRDDNRWMWPQQQDARTDPAPPPPAPAPVPLGLGERLPDEAPSVPPLEPTRRHPEWDHRIERLRPAWCAVYEEREHPATAVQGDAPAAAEPWLADHPLRAVARRAVQQVLRRPPAAHSTSRQLAAEGDSFDLDALLRAGIAHRQGRSVDLPVYLRSLPPPSRGAVVVLVDQSASSVSSWAGAELQVGTGRHSTTTPPTSLLQTASLSAALLADALQSAGFATQVCGFSSDGRHRVHLQDVLTFGEALDTPALQRLAALRSSGSTRLGAVLRHAAWRLAQRSFGTPTSRWGLERRWVLLVSDGQPHDIDVHDPVYLGVDARMAVQRARHQGIQMACLSLPVRGSVAPGQSRSGRDSSGQNAARKIFGAGRVVALDRLDGLPVRIAQLVRACMR
jgi:hypothetical protein